MPGSQNRKYYIIGMHIYYILLVYHVNTISTSCFRVICRHCLLSFSLAFLLPIVDLLLALSASTYSTTDILCSCTTMPREKCVRSGEKRIICNNYFEQQSKKQKVATPLKYGQKKAEATGFARHTVDKIVREK